MSAPDDQLIFVRARLAEELEQALAASPGPWHLSPEEDEVLAADDIPVADAFALSGKQLRATARHIAAHDPVQVVRQVRAGQKLLRRYEEAVITLANAGGSGEIHVLMTGAVNTLRAVLLDLAQVYADHPGYREEWRR